MSKNLGENTEGRGHCPLSQLWGNGVVEWVQEGVDPPHRVAAGRK